MPDSTIMIDMTQNGKTKIETKQQENAVNDIFDDRYRLFKQHDELIQIRIEQNIRELNRAARMQRLSKPLDCCTLHPRVDVAPR